MESLVFYNSKELKMEDRLQPYSEQLEIELINAILNDTTAIELIYKIVSQEAFYFPVHALIFEASKNNYLTKQPTTPDAIIGKATRKARKWLHDTINGFEIPEGDAGDVPPAPAEVEGISLEDLKELFELKKDKLTVAEQKRAQVIIDTQECASYEKLRVILKDK